MFPFRSSNRFSSNRWVQAFAWIICVLSILIFTLGIIITHENTSSAKEEVIPTAQNALAIESMRKEIKKLEAQNVADKSISEKTISELKLRLKTLEIKVAPKVKKKKEELKKIKIKRVGNEKSSWMDRLISLFGLFLLVGIAVAMSNNRRKINWKLVGVGIGLQVVFGFVILGPGREAFDWMSSGITALLNFTNAGSGFLFNSFVTGKTEVGLINFTFAVLPTIIFFSAFMTVLYHIGIMQWVVKGFAFVMQKGMRISGAESLSAAANIFVGQTEAPLVIKPYVNDMTMSELMTVMTGGFATVAGGVFAIYVGMLEPMFPEIAGHLLTASVMSAPAALVIGKIVIPETEEPATMGNIDMSGEKEDVNVLDAASRGAAEGLKLALNVAAMLLAFLALLALVDALIGAMQFWATTPLKLQEIFGVPFGWLAWTMGVPWEDCPKIGELFAVKMIVNELVAYSELQKMLQAGEQLSDRSIIIATYALCGFANFGSIGIQLGGIGGIAPERKADLAKIALKAMIAGTIAAFMTGTIAGILI